MSRQKLWDAVKEVETGVELDGVIKMSPLKVLLTATVGALLGSLLCWVIREVRTV